MNRPMELDIWKGDWGLASVDLECLRVVALCKFAGAPVQVNIKNHALNSPKGKLPVFRHYKHTLTSFDAISSYLCTKNLSPDFGLDARQKGETFAYTTLLQDFLYPVILYVWWIDVRNQLNLSRKWWSKTLPFPLCMFLPDRYRKAAQQSVEGLFQNIDDERMLETQIYERATACLTHLSNRLGNQEFMFGSHPTSLDATVFAYLAPLIKVPFPNGTVKNLVISNTNLLKYVTRISQRYFAAETQAYEANRQQDPLTNSGRQVDDFPHKRRNQILATVFAVIAMAGYAISTGLLQIPPRWIARFVKTPRVTVIPMRFS